MSQPTSSQRPSQCPAVEALKAFLLGILPEPELDIISAHLDGCTHCMSVVMTLNESDDSLIASLRAIKSLEYASKPFEASGAQVSDAVIDAADLDPASIEAAVDASFRTSQRETITEPLDATTPAEPRTPVRLDRYLLLRKLGKGGFGTVYLARDRDLGRMVAIKIPHRQRTAPQRLSEFHSEARLHAALDHRHIVPVYDVGRAPGFPFFIVSKFIPGSDLAQAMKQKRLTFREAAELVATAAEALEHMHAKGLVHRDLKPRNILVDDAGAPHLADFGLARYFDVPVNDIAGTPGYMSPEQVEGAAVDPRSDIFSLGVILYELLAGVRPFQGKHDILVDEIVRAAPVPLRRRDAAIPLDLEAICRKALAKNPADRYQRAADVAEDLRRFLRGEPATGARRVPFAESAWAWLHRNRKIAVLAGVAAAALTLAAVLALRPPRDTGEHLAPAAPPTLPRVLTTIASDPPGADIFYVPLDNRTGLPLPAQGTRAKAGAPVELEPGHYVVVAALEGGKRFHEVFRYLPDAGARVNEAYFHNRSESRDGVVWLHRVRIPPPVDVSGMALFDGAAEFVVGAAGDTLAPAHRRRVPPFYLDCTEVTIAAYRKMRSTYQFPNGKAMAPDTHPATFLSWDDAVSFAEYAGKRLPDEAEYEFAATLGGTRRFPWGDAPAPIRDWTFGAVGTPAADRVERPGQPPVFGLYSNVAEWTGSWFGLYPGARGVPPFRTLDRVVRGGDYAVIRGEPHGKDNVSPRRRVLIPSPVRTHAGLGFRCARSPKPRLTPEDFGAILAD